MDLLKHKISAIKDQVANDNFIKERKLESIASALTQRYLSSHFGDETPSEKLLRLKADNNDGAYNSTWGHEPASKDLWERDDYNEVIPKLVIYWNKKLYESEATTDDFLNSKNELPSGPVKFYPEKSEKSEFVNYPNQFDKLMFGDLDFNFNSISHKVRDVIVTPDPQNILDIWVIEDSYVSFLPASDLSENMKSRLLSNLYKKIDTNFNNPKMISKEENDKISETKEYIKNIDGFIKAANIDNLRISSASKKAAQISVNTKDSTYPIFTEIIFSGKKIAVPTLALHRAAHMTSIHPSCDIYYDEAGKKLIFLSETAYAIIDTDYGDADLWDTINMEAFTKGITARQVQKIEEVVTVEHFTAPSDLLERKPKLAEIIERQKVLVPKMQIGGIPKVNTYDEIINLAHEYIASYTNIVNERGVEIRKAVIPQHKLNTLSYVYEVDDIFWEYNPDIEVDELLAFFVSKGKNDNYQTLCLKILGIDYMLNYNALVDALIERRLLMIDNIKIDAVTKRILELKYEYLHFYASGNIYAKKKQLEKIQNDLIEYYGSDNGMRIIAAQNEILDERVPAQCLIISAEKDKQLELDINHEMFFESSFPPIATRSSIGVRNIREQFQDYFHKIPKLGGITDSDIEDGYFEPLDKASFIKKYILPNWKYKGRTYDFESSSWTSIADALDFQPERKPTKFNKKGEAIVSLSDYSVDDQITVKEIQRAIIAAYHERITRIKNDGSRIFNLFLKSEVTNSFQQLISQIWNEKYNNYSAAILNKVPIFIRIARYFGTDNKLLRLKKVQTNGIKFFIARDNSALLAHEVGFGKTLTSIGAISHMMETGEASRVLLMTPKRVYEKFLREGKGAGNFRGAIPHINFVELYNAKPDVFLPVLNQKGEVIKWNLKHYEKDDLKTIEFYRQALAEIGRKADAMQNRRLEPDNASIEMIEETIAKFVPNSSQYKFFGDMIKKFESNKSYTIDKIQEEKEAVEAKQGAITPKEEAKLKAKYGRIFSDEVMDTLYAMKNMMIDEMGTFFPDVFKPKSIILATHVAIEDLRPSQVGIDEAIAAIDDVNDTRWSKKESREIPDARDKTLEWSFILNNNPISIERLNIDGIVVDEVHNFNELISKIRPRYYTKKRSRRSEDEITYLQLPIGSRDSKGRHVMRYYYSMPSETNKDKVNLLAIVMDIAAKNKDKKQNAIMLSATPFTEGPLHMFSVMNLVNRRRLKELNMASSYNFFMNFIWEAWKFDVTIDGRKGLFATIDKYRNNMGMCNFMAAFSDFKITDEEIEKLRPVKYIIPDDENRIGGITSYVPLTDVQKSIKYSIGEFIAGRIKEEDICRITRQEDIDEIDEDASSFDAEAMVESGNLRKQEIMSARIFKAKSMQEKMVISPYLMGCLPEGVKLPPLDDILRHPDGTPILWEGKEVPAAPKNFVENSPKILYAINCIQSVLEKHEQDGTRPSGQIIYLNMGKDFVYQNVRYKGGVYQLIAEYLTHPVYRPDIGLVPSDIGVIHGGITDEGLVTEIQRKFNDGRIKVLLGSASIREGIDLQENSTAMYIINAEYNPTNAMQLEGRIWRQGNKWKNVRVVYVLAYDSIDVFIYSKLKNKINSVREIMRAGKCDLNETHTFSLDPGEVQINLTTNVDDLADLSWQNEERKLRMELERRNSEINLLRLIHKNYPKIKTEYDNLLKRLNYLSDELGKVKYQDLKDTVEHKIRSAEREKPIEDQMSAAAIEKQAEELIEDGTYKRTYEHVDFNESMSYTLFQQRLDVLRSNYKIARQWEGRKALHEKEIEDLKKQIANAEIERNKLDESIKANPVIEPASIEDLGKPDQRIKALAEADRFISKWKADLNRAIYDKTKQQLYWEAIIAAGFKDFEDYDKSVNRFTSGSDNDTVLNAYNSQVTAAGMKFSDVDDIIESQQEEIKSISDRINNKDREVAKLVTKYTKLLEDRKKKGKFSLYDQIAAYETTNYLVQ